MQATDTAGGSMAETAPRRILVLTGKRGGYGAMKPMLDLLDRDPYFDLQLVVTDQHVNPRFGRTVQEIEPDFTVAASIDMEQQDGSATGRAAAVGRCAVKMISVLENLSPHLCLLYGDRGEVLATAMTATILGLPIAHLQGGDVSGSLDDNMRHAITKLSHLHFASTAASAERIRRMGEEDWRIHVVGDSHVDPIVAGEFSDPETVSAELNLDIGEPIIVVLQHSETTAPDQSHVQMVETLEAVRATGLQTVVVYPCSDQGYEGIVRAIDELAHSPQFRAQVNLEAPLFRGLLNVASVMVGNSSAGLIETPYFCIPAINIGRRQTGRLHAENVLHVDHDRTAILAAIEASLADSTFRETVDNCTRLFGDGHAGARVVDILRDLAIDRALLVKQFMQ